MNRCCFWLLAALALAACSPLDDFEAWESGSDVDADTDADGDGDGAPVGDGGDGDGDAEPTEEDPIAQLHPQGCSDDQREGFVSVADYPSIAACAGGWSTPGILATQPACARLAGDDSAAPEGLGCSAADLCAPGWRVCRGRAEVAARAPAGCGAAVPAGTPDKELFFAVAQASSAGMSCASAAGDNDVFGCGNLGIELGAASECAPLNRALGSASPSTTCGYNEAGPPLGPWRCTGVANSHEHEAAWVAKDGCTSAACTWDGRAIGNADRGGVLCCK